MKKLTGLLSLGMLLFLLPISCKKESATVSGYVTALDTGEPIEGVTIYLRHFQEARKKNCNNDGEWGNYSTANSDSRRTFIDSTLTDKNGFYHFDSPYPDYAYPKRIPNYFGGRETTTSNLREDTDNVKDYTFEPYAFVKYRAKNVSGTHKLLIYGLEDYPYSLVIAKNETGELIVPSKNGPNFEYLWLYSASGGITHLIEHMDCTYRDTTLVELEY